MTRPQRGMTWDEIDRLRRLVHVPADRHLANWASWARHFRVEIGHRSRSTGFSGTGMSSAEDLEAEVTPLLLSGVAEDLRTCRFLLETGPSHRFREETGSHPQSHHQ